MGCDIHAYAEVRREGKWEYVPIESDQQKNRRKIWLNGAGDGIASLNIGRNYDLFAILANVRNCGGFAGCDTGDGFNPISKPKGLPADVSLEVKAESDSWNGDGHSHSWHTLAGVLSYNWTQRTKLCGWVEGPVYEKWVRYGRDRGESPKIWCEGALGPSIEHISVQEMDRRVANLLASLEGRSWSKIEAESQAKLGNYYCLLEWEQPYYKTCQGFWSDIVPELLWLGKPEDVRMVFWFDN